MKLKPYPKYKESGTQWIGEIPKGWEIKKVKHITFNLDGKRVPISSELREEGETPYYGATSVLDYVKGHIFNETLLLVGEDGAPFFEPNKDVSYIIKGKTWVNNHAHVLRVLKSNNEKWLCYFMNSNDYGIYIKGSTRDKLNQDELSNITITLPSVIEQNKIASFLDSKTSQLSQTISADKKLIELLKEKRTALINHVVTKGLNPKAKMKDSGIEWIGEVSEGWEVKKIKQVSDVRISNINKKSEENEPDVLLCNYVDVYKNEFITSEINFMKATASIEQIKKFTIKKDDVIITKDSEEPTDIAVPALVMEDFKGVVCGYHLALIKPNKKYLCGGYLFRSFQSKKINDQFVVEANGVTRFGISTYPINNSFLIIPPKSEQIQISQYLDKSTSKIDQTIKKIEEKIELLEEYKKSLIHHVVTGKVDVRGITA